MKKVTIIIAIIQLMTIRVIAQTIKPYDLLQLYKYSELKEDKYGLSAYRYLTSLDTGWRPTANPILTDKDATVSFAYTKNGKSWYKPESYHITISRTYSNPQSNGLVYKFTESELWNAYIYQMSIMNATTVGSNTRDGAKVTIYTVNGLAFAFSDFPPGLQGPDRTYQITIMTGDQ